jgi:hypothetical protein
MENCTHVHMQNKLHYTSFGYKRKFPTIYFAAEIFRPEFKQNLWIDLKGTVNFRLTLQQLTLFLRTLMSLRRQTSTQCRINSLCRC